MNTEQIARVCHNVNAAYCKSIGDNTQKDWVEAAQWQKDSAIKGVEFKLNNPEVTPADQHNAWCESKVADGWVYGSIKDPTNKTHPCLVNYDKLPQEQKVKDYLFQAVVISLRD